MRRILCLLAPFVTLAFGSAAAQSITITAPAGGAQPVASANDFATRVMQDPWDMSQRSDLAWWLNSADSPSPGFSAINFNNGVFTGTVSSVPNVMLLETGSPSLPPVGKTGAVYPIDANLYRLFAIRMRVSQPGYMLFHWGSTTIYDPAGPQVSHYTFTTSGWRIYLLDLPTLGMIGPQYTDTWSGTKRWLRLHPMPPDVPAGSTVEIDWVRLVENNASLQRTVTWNNPGWSVDIYLDNDNDPTQTLGLLASDVSGGQQSSRSYTFNVGALEPGNYYVAMRRAGTGEPLVYSSGYYQVNAPATVTVTAPSEEGSDDDFATVHLNNPWDMKSAADVDTTLNMTNTGVVTVPGAVTEEDAPLGNVTAFAGTSTTGVFGGGCSSFAKPVVYPLHMDRRGAIHHIDPTKYRILTAELGLPNKARDLCGGSIVRVVWRVAGQINETYSWGISLNSRAGANVVNKISVDMADRTMLPIDPESPSQAGWVPGSSSFPGISDFRIDPHEFANPTPFFIKRIKLAALETANASYTVRWTSSKAGGTVRVYYDTDRNPNTKTLIGSTSATSTSGSLVWNTSSLPQGQQYYVYVEFDDGLNVNGAYSKWPIRIDRSAANARLVLNRTNLNFGVTAGTVRTPAQVVRLTTLNGSPCWTASSDLAFLTVTPSSGCGSAMLTVNLVNMSYQGSVDYTGYVRVASASAVNSPQVVPTTLRVRPISSAPQGIIDTPANNAAVRGSVAVTGWAIDDIGVARVSICRDPVTGEAGGHPLCGPNQIYLGDGVNIDDMRPDIEAYSPTTPMNYRAGWGFLVLTNTLPFQGNGGFNLHVHVFDVEGHRASLGSRTIYGQNSSAFEPFGTIDTPGQGATISGTSYANFGWVLSRVNRADPPGGGVVRVYIDGVDVGAPCCWNQRADLNALFPGYPGLSTALGVFGFNTTAYGNGLHTIAWVVTDNAGRTSGVGSRFFSIFNTGSPLTVAGVMRPSGNDLGKRLEDVDAVVSDQHISVREGFVTGRTMESANGSADGVRRVRATERDRLEIRLTGADAPKPGDEYAAYQVVNGRLREIPVGSAFSPERGAFYWQPALGFMGDYDLLFVRTRADGGRERIPVRVTLAPKMDDRPLAGVWARIELGK